MVEYLTPAQLRAQDLGVNLTGLSDTQLASWIRTASATVNEVTNQSSMPAPHDFRGASVTGETHTWRIDPYDRTPTHRVFLYHTPVTVVSSFRVYATNDQYVEIPGNQLYYESSEGWIEPTSVNFTSYGLFGATMLPFIGLEQPHSKIDYSYGSRYPLTERLLYDELGPAWTWRASTGFWTVDDPVVRVNDVVADPGDYTVDRIEGTVTFTANKPVDGDVIDADYITNLHPDIGRATGMIAGRMLVDKRLVSTIPTGVKRLTVAELTLQFDSSSSSSTSSNTSSGVAVPDTAMALLHPFVNYPLAFG